jgi:ATP-binding protein involved in chromosome partitioning
MFEQVKVPILGVVENMSFLECPHCKERIDVFSSGGGRRMAGDLGVNFLGALPMTAQVRIGGDTGQPVATFGENDPRGKDFFERAKRVVEQAAEVSSVTGPTMTVTD